MSNIEAPCIEEPMRNRQERLVTELALAQIKRAWCTTQEQGWVFLLRVDWSFFRKLSNCEQQIALVRGVPAPIFEKARLREVSGLAYCNVG